MLNPNFNVTANTIRVFAGFRHPDLNVAAFLEGLGRTFMPGTPYMLQPNGLAAYIPGVVQEEAGSPCPHEIALIIWPSIEVQRMATRETLRGRVYTQSHGGVYDNARTKAYFPKLFDAFDPTKPEDNAFYLFGESIDWQEGATFVHTAAKRDPQMSGVDFRSGVLQLLRDCRAKLQAGGVDECICMVRDDYLIVWSHHIDPQAQNAPSWSLLDAVASLSSAVLATRVICRDEPPVVTVQGTMALNFIFERSAKWFLH